MTTLAARVKSLRDKSLARDVSDKKRASLVFDSKEAAMFDRDEVFNIGVSGFQQLVERNKDFEKFEKTLFCKSLMNLERTGMNKEENEQLDKVINEFLMTVSPFFLVKAAQLSLDWLIYRFHIHQMNVDEFVLCMLPHHDHEMFPRALQLIKLDDRNARWHFLHDCAKNNIPLPRRVLINQVKKAPGFLRFMCEKLASQIEKFGTGSSTTRQALLLYRTLMAGAIEKRIELNEDIVKTIIDYICHGVMSPIHELKLVNYAVLAQLAGVVPLMPQKLLKLIEILLKHVEPNDCKQAMCCLVSVFASQKISLLPEKTSALLRSAMEDLPDDELSTAIQKKLMDLISPPDEVEVMSVDDINPTSRLLEDLRHRKSSRRVSAVRQLSGLINEGSQEFSDGFIEDALLNQLNDDNHKVVHAVLELGEKLVKLTDAAKLLTSLINLVEKNYSSSKWRAEVELALSLICSEDVFRATPGLSIIVLGWLLVSNEDLSGGFARNNLRSTLVKEDRVMGLLSAADLSKALDGAYVHGLNVSDLTACVKHYNWLLITDLANVLANLSEADFKEMMFVLTQPRHSTSGRGLFLLVSSLSVALNVVTGDPEMLRSKRLTIAVDLLKLLELIGNQPSSDSDENAACLEKDLNTELVPWLVCLQKNCRVPVELVQWSVLQLIGAVGSYTIPDDVKIVDRSHPLVAVLGKVFEIISSGGDWLPIRLRLEQVLTRQDAVLERKSLFKILALILSDIFDHEGRDPKWVPQGVYLVLFEMIESIFGENMTIQDFVFLPVLPGLLVSLHSSHQDIRIGAVRCLQRVQKICRLSEGLQHGDRLKKLLKRKQIVMVDHEYATEIAYEFCRSLPSIDLQRTFVTLLIDLGLQSAEPFITNAVKNCLQKLELDGTHVSHELVLPDGDDVSTAINKGRKKARVTTTLSQTLYRRLVLILEVLESRKKVGDAVETTNQLFKLLSKLVHEEGEKSEHCQQLTLACLTKICKRWKLSDLDTLKGTLCKANLDVESLRMCISDSKNPQIQQQALTILAAIAPLYPEYVMENAIPIFTFMGSNLIQLDNSHTFQVVISVIDAFMTAIVNSLEKTKKTSDVGVIVDLMRIFVDVRHQIPCHRRLPLFNHLVERVGVETHLCSLVVLIMESSIRKPDASGESAANQDQRPEMLALIDKDIELVVDVCGQFSANDQLKSVTQMVIFLQKLLSAHSQGLSALVEKKLPVIDITTMNPMRMRLLLVHLSATAVKILDHRDLVVEVLKRAEGQKLDEILEGLLRDLVLQSLAYLSEATRQQGGSHAGTCSPRFWVKLLGNVSKILYKVTYLLPTASFLEVIQSLLDHEILSIQLRALEILASKVCPIVIDDKLDASSRVSAVDLTNLSADEILSLEKLISKLTKIIERPMTDQISCHQNTLYCLQLLCHQIGKDRPQLFTAVIPVVIKIAAAPNVQPLLLDNALTCMAVFCRTLGSRFLLKHLFHLMSPVLALLANAEFLQSNETTLICLLTCVEKIIACFSEMLDNYLPRLLGFVCLFPVVLTKNAMFKKPATIEKLLNSITNQIAKSLECRVLLPKAKETFSELLETNQNGLGKFFEILQLHISSNGNKLSRDSDDLVLLVDIFDVGMNLRSTANQLSWEDMEKTEAELINAVLAMVLSLTDKQFVSIYLKLFTYTDGDIIEQHNRQLTFFKLTNSLAAKLQELFIQYAGHILKAASDFLTESLTASTWFIGEDAIRKTCSMLDCVIGSIHKCLISDKDGSFGVKVVSKLANPIVDQLENFVGGDEEYKKRVVELVVPCIGQLIIAAKKTGTWKDISYKICLKSQNTNPVVKVAALLAIEEMARKLGLEYDALLPETTPFLAELFEDDDDEVRKECNRVKCAIEEVIGESLSDCFV